MNTYKVYWIEEHRAEVDAYSEEEAIEKALEAFDTLARPVLTSDVEVVLVNEDPIDKEETERDASYGQ